jgi:hypothetical protein
MQLTEIYKQIPQSTCPHNCGECCGILFPSMAELRNVQTWCSKKHLAFKNFNMTTGLDCPYLDTNKQCSIYPVRPFLCRILGVCSDLPCPLNKNDPVKVLNHQQSAYLYKQIYLRGKEKPRTEKHRKLIKQLLHI